MTTATAESRKPGARSNGSTDVGALPPEDQEATSNLLAGVTAASKAGKRKAPKNVHEAKLRVMEEVFYLQKKKPERGGVNYPIIGCEEFLLHLHPHFLRQGLVLAPIACASVPTEPYPSSKGGTLMQHHKVMVTYRLTHVDTDTYEDVVAMGEGSDTGDKGLAKALTNALKAALRQAFMIRTGEQDPDEVPSDNMAQTDPTREPMGESYKKCMEAVMRATSPASIDAILKRAYPSDTKDWSYTPTQLWYICREANRVRVKLEAEQVKKN